MCALISLCYKSHGEVKLCPVVCAHEQRGLMALIKCLWTHTNFGTLTVLLAALTTFYHYVCFFLYYFTVKCNSTQ